VVLIGDEVEDRSVVPHDETNGDALEENCVFSTSICN
jgi:hypothetical protein